MKAYKIKLENDYNDYYVIAKDFNDAESKVCLHKTEEREEKKKAGIFMDDGSLRPEITGVAKETPIVVKTIEMLTDKIIS